MKPHPGRRGGGRGETKTSGQPHLTGVCLVCGREDALAPRATVCPACGGNLDIRHDHARIARRLARDGWPRLPGLWRYLPLLPLSAIPEALRDGRATLLGRVGRTPLHRLRILEDRLGLARVYLKDETVEPSASFKDRASAVALARGLQEGDTLFATASTGNAGASLACLCASAGVPSVILVPAGAPRGKLAQLALYGCRLVRVDGSYDEAFELCRSLEGRPGVTVRSTGRNPFTREGKKTVSYEIHESLRRVPDWVVVPVGDGNILSGTYKGFDDLLRLGSIRRVPRLAAIQAEGSAAIARAFRSGATTVDPVRAATLADSISVDCPRDGAGALAALRGSDGLALTVTDAQILDAMAWLARTCGLFVEPAAAAAVAGLKAMVHEGHLGQKSTVAVLLTGSGLKDPEKAIAAAPLPDPVPPDPAMLGAVLDEMRRMSYLE